MDSEATDSILSRWKRTPGTVLSVLVLLLCCTSVPALGMQATSPGGANAAPPPDMLRHINDARSSAQTCGEKDFEPAPPLTWSDDLAAAAQAHNEDMTTEVFRGHEGSNGSAPHERVERITNAFSAVGETISYFTESNARAVTRWLDSPGHCRVLMNSDLTHVGAHSTRGPRFNDPEREGVYRTAVFGRLRAGLRLLPESDRMLLRNHAITVYGRGTRGRTRALRTSLEYAGIPFTYRDIEADTTHRQAMIQALQAGPEGMQVTLPVVQAGDYVFTGVATAHALARMVRAYEEAQPSESSSDR